jgi:hypothetical protein
VKLSLNGAESDLSGIFKNFSLIAEDVSVKKIDDGTVLFAGFFQIRF